MAIGVFAFAGLCFFGTLMLVENSTELLAQTVLPVREPRMAWGKNNPVGEAKGIYPGRVVWTHAPGAATWEKGDGFWFFTWLEFGSFCELWCLRYPLSFQ